MIGNIYITGEIGVNVHLVDVIKQVQDQKDALEYNVYINSIGGFVDVGFDIYNFLENLNKPITTIGTGYVCSIATVIFLAGSKRILKNGAEFMVHNPSGGVEGTAEQIASYNKELINAENNLIKFYSEKTGLTKEALIPLLRNETFLNIDEALSLGFSTEKIVENITASFKINNNIKNEKKMNSEDKNWLEKSFPNLGKKYFKPNAIMLIDANGNEINFPEVEEGINPQVGDKGQIDGKPVEDGTYIMPSLNNASVTFVGGAITEITEVDSEMENLKKENESLKTQLSEMTANFENSNKKLTDFENEFKELKNKFTAKFNFESKKETKEEAPAVDARLEKLKNKFKK